MVDVAEAAGVSRPIVTRIATTLGSSGYAEFRRAARERVLFASPSDSPPPGLGTLPSAVVAGERHNLRALEEMTCSDHRVCAVDLLSATGPSASLA